MKFCFAFCLFVILSVGIFSQTDTTRYPWPINPMTQQREITGTFAEYRSTSEAGHYHNGTDIPGAAGTPVLSVLPGVIAVAYDDGGTGYDSYVRVTSTINGQSKNITYYHCRPIVSVGQYVNQGQQVATIAIDHIHLIEYRLNGSLNNSHLNAIRPDGGLTPYVDTWKPKIRFIKFILDNSTTYVPASGLGNKIDILVHIEEANGVSSSASNNGPYEAGYKILSADRQTVIYNPPDDGMRFRFYNKPGDSYVNVNYYKPESSTSMHVMQVTNGTGASNVALTQTVSNSFWDVTQHPYGNYVLMVFTKDVKGNADTAYVNITTTDIDLIPPGQSNLKYIRQDSLGYFTIAWRKPADQDLKGYRLFYSQSGSGYALRDNENVLTNQLMEKQYQFGLNSPLFLKINAVDNAPMANLSIPSDVYGVRMKNDNKKILIVDGFNRFGSGGSWGYQYHDFIIRYSDAFGYSYDCAHNTQIEDGTIALSNYEVVFWMLGDESTADRTFNDNEKVRVSQYLDNGGKLFVSGSEIAYDLEGNSSATSNDKLFLKKYLKAKYVADNSGTKMVSGVASTTFQGVSLLFGLTAYGSPYPEDYPDAIDTADGSSAVLLYDNSMKAGVAYTGSFGNPNKSGQVIYMSFPFETIGALDQRKSLMNSIFSYFGYVTDVNEPYASIPNNYVLEQNFPNPFNPTTTIAYRILGKDGEKQFVSLKVFDILGREVAVLVQEEQKTGFYEVSFNACALSSGIYIYRLTADNFVVSKKMTILK